MTDSTKTFICLNEYHDADNSISMEEHRVAPEYVNWIEWQKRGLPLNDH